MPPPGGRLVAGKGAWRQVVASLRASPSLLEGLNSQRSRPAAFWDAVKVLAGHLNGLEQMGLLHVLDAGSEVLDLHPHRLGFRRSVIAEFGRRWLAVELCEEDGRILLYPQLVVDGMDFRHLLVRECWRVHGHVKGSVAGRLAG